MRSVAVLISSSDKLLWRQLLYGVTNLKPCENQVEYFGYSNARQYGACRSIKVSYLYIHNRG